MTNQQAINILLSLPLQAPSDGEMVEIQTAVKMAVKALEQINLIKFNIYALNELIKEADNEQ